MERLTTWKRGAVVRTIGEVHDLTKAEALPPGQIGILFRLDRTQDGIEVWAVWFGQALWSAPHTRLVLYRSL